MCSQSAFLPRRWNPHINSVGSGQVPFRLDPAHSLPFPQIQWSSTQSSTENERESPDQHSDLSPGHLFDWRS
ncbi:hypothetical protein ASPTUDRAFT_500810 [Aspergillus tubingensis CBS 134.48]|uniref:Uncharacterized protein n=1 Tax=Aspergillus tubingensis (strain CBS 134.48) TaxID=767770 RepID=A0A1L9NCJ0_ASPTC|nr:hypothetical protein ASPTUDRAFT_500810 [Aspergillus tubingensis CBS 134.48]